MVGESSNGDTRADENQGFPHFEWNSSLPVLGQEMKENLSNRTQMTDFFSTGVITLTLFFLK